MPNIRAMVIHQGFSLLPEDRFVNTYHFVRPLGDLATNAAALAAVFEDMYNTPLTSTQDLSNYLSPAISRTIQLRFYDLDEPEPRVPVEDSFEIGAAPSQSGAGLPEEVSVCLSFHGAPPITPRRRGRIYFGPLGSTGVEITPATGTAYTRVTNQLMVDLLDAAEILHDGADGTWAIRSSVPVENFVEVVGGWVDSAPDTQRRRGTDAVVRLTWPQ